MHIVHKTGDVIAATGVGEAFAHGCNTHGLMGAGIAKAVRSNFPRTYSAYQRACMNDTFAAGSHLIVEEKGVFVVNLASQKAPGADAKLHYLGWSLENACRELWKDHFIKEINMPLIGCGIGGLEWTDVEKVIRGIQGPTTVNVYTL